MVRLHCTLMLYLHVRTSIRNELRYHVNHLHEFIVYIPPSLTFSHPAQPSSLSPLPSRHSTLKQHSSSILSSPSFKHLYLNTPVRIGLVVLKCPSAVSSSISDVLWGETERLNPALTSELNCRTPHDLAAATYVRSRSSVV